MRFLPILPGESWLCLRGIRLIKTPSTGEACRAFPGWIKLVLIRKVTDIAAVGIKEKNEPERFEKAFEGVPR